MNDDGKIYSELGPSVLNMDSVMYHKQGSDVKQCHVPISLYN